MPSRLPTAVGWLIAPHAKKEVLVKRPASIIVAEARWRRHAFRAGCLAWLTTVSTVGAEPVRYTVTDLGTIPGSTVCPCFFGIALNNNGQVVGRFFGDNGRY